MSNTVITIARQYGSGGRTVGKMLAKRLDIPCYDREIISLASEESGIHPTLFQDEKKRHGSLRAFLTGGFKNASPLSPESAGFTKDDNLFRYQAKIIRQLAEESSCVIIGRCADHILADVPGVVRVFVHAPEDFCLQEAMKVNSLSVSAGLKKIHNLRLCPSDRRIPCPLLQVLHRPGMEKRPELRPVSGQLPSRL